ncbi:hypothetical protein GY45DRAFT_1355416 [Cubamyces sp. BRFM 1775]|nr:hypothetical protein GY45DRAFT_1355416 [Cubamyces sp. BRFM 1775]
MELPNAKVGGNIFYCPSPGSYAVIRLNPVEMVRPFEDAQALLEAHAMRPKSYLIMLQMELGLPWPDQPWYRFEVEPIATSLRPEDKTRGITPDLCIPIYPNTSHPTGRIPVKPEPEGLFPYDNCYHWFDAKLVGVRIRARPEEFDETNAVALSVDSRMHIEQALEKELPHILEIKRRPQSVASATSEPSRDLPALSSSVEHYNTSPQCFAGRESSEISSMCSGVTSTRDRPSNHSLDDLAAMDIFSGPNEDVELRPLVDLWISELGDHLKQEDIPNPVDMFEEFGHIARIVKEARVRLYAALTAPVPVLSEEPAVNARDSPQGQSRMFPRFRPAKSLRKLRTRAKQLSARLESIFHPPSILVWP